MKETGDPVNAADSGLTPPARERFDRNIRLPAVGEEGQRKLLASSAMVVGAGGLGSPAILYLAAAGVGRLRIADSERLELSNLNRQVLHRTADIGRPKVESARDALLALAPDCSVETVSERITESSARQAVRGMDVVLDCTDNFPTRFVIADACWREGVPMVSAACVGMQGQLFSVVPAESSPCYRCLLPGPPPPGAAPTALQAGILGAVAGVFGALQAAEAVKIMLGIGRNYAHHMLVCDALAGTFRTVRRTRDPACSLCGAPQA